MPRIILQYPILRHYAGSVFDLDISFESDDDDNERLINRQPSKTIYHLPDGGKGFPTEISISDIFYCPPSVFEGVDLTTGPCRITSARTQASNGADVPTNQQLTMEKVVLTKENQCISLALMPTFPRPQSVQIFDRKNNQMLKDQPMNTPSVFLDFSAFTAGFYEIKIGCKQDIMHIVTVIKCFPLVVTIDVKTGSFTTMKTIW